MNQDREIEEFLRKESYPVQTDAQLGKEILSIDDDSRVFEYYVPKWVKGIVAVALKDKNGRIKTGKAGEPIYNLQEIEYIKEMKPKIGKLPLKFVSGDTPKSNLDLADVRLMFYIGMLEEILVKAMFVEPNRDYTYSLVTLNKLKNDLIQLKRAYRGFAVKASKATVRYDYVFEEDDPERSNFEEKKQKQKIERKLREEQEPSEVPQQTRGRGNRLFEAYFGRQ